MQKLLALILLSMYISLQVPAQCNYLNKQYNVTWEKNVLYGTANAYDGAPTDLFLNIYKPINDNNTARPLLLMIHGGGFTGGTKEEMDSMCYWYAQRGYVTATISYRLGFYGPGFLSAPFTYDSAEVIRAAARAVQDAHGALRYMKGRATQDSVDVNLAFVGGASAGSITALHLAFADKAWEKPPATDSISNVVNSFVNKSRGDLGPMWGYLNMNGQTSQVQAVVNLFGGLIDSNYIESAGDVPTFSYHQTLDPVVGCDYKVGLWNMPLGVSQNYPHLYGSCVLNDRFNNLGYTSAHYQSLIYNGNTHGIHNEPLVDGLIAVFLNDRICEVLTSGVGETNGIEHLQLFPNPATEAFQISGIAPGSGFTCIIRDVIGREVSRNFITPQAGTETISCGMLPSGYYLVTIANTTTSRTWKVAVVK